MRLKIGYNLPLVHLDHLLEGISRYENLCILP
jgi:hypothetical protein